MKTIPLTQSFETIIDDEDYEKLSYYQWFVMLPSFKAGRKEGGKVIYMSRQIMNAPPHLQVDHTSGDGLDNRRSNLRLCISAQNTRNQKLRQGCISKYKGVVWNRNRWSSRITFEKHRYSLGRSKSEIQAAVFYDLAAAHFFKEFARFNFPEHKRTYEMYWKSKNYISQLT